MNVDGLPFPQKIVKGQEIITKETGNPNVLGNTAILAAFATSQTGLEEAVAAALAARNASKQATLALYAADAAWKNQLMLLAAFTETATGGDPVKIVSAGFEVRGTPAPTPALGPVGAVTVSLNGAPGHSKLSWPALAGADGYVVQGSPDPITATSWTQSQVTTKLKCTANGATPGQKYWYRVAGFNSLGQGPWSEIAARPVM